MPSSADSTLGDLAHFIALKMNCPVEHQKSTRNSMDSQIDTYNCQKKKIPKRFAKLFYCTCFCRDLSSPTAAHLWQRATATVKQMLFVPVHVKQILKSRPQPSAAHCPAHHVVKSFIAFLHQLSTRQLCCLFFFLSGGGQKSPTVMVVWLTVSISKFTRLTSWNLLSLSKVCQLVGCRPCSHLW